MCFKKGLDKFMKERTNVFGTFKRLLHNQFFCVLVCYLTKGTLTQVQFTVINDWLIQVNKKEIIQNINKLYSHWITSLRSPCPENLGGLQGVNWT